MGSLKNVVANQEQAITRVAVLGVGLVGGSIALAAQRAGCAVQVYDVSPETNAAAREAGLTTVATPADLCPGTEALFIAVPVEQVQAVAAMIKGSLESSCIVTDVSSVKRPVQGLPGLLGSSRSPVILGHPMAGSHTSGFGSARADLFEGCTWLLCDAETSPEADRLAALLLRIGAGRVLDCPTHTHDTLVAAVSHLPQVAATALSATVGYAVETIANGAFELAGGGFRDATRIAESSYQLWRPILRENSTVLAMLLEELAGRVTEAADALRRGDDRAVESLFANGNAARRNWRDAQPATDAAPAAPIQPSDSSRWEDPISGEQAWLDRSFAWETIRTSASEPQHHALLSARYLATLFELDPRRIDNVEKNITHGEAAARAIRAAGGHATARSTWTADGLHVEGVDLPDGRYIVVI